MRGGVEERLALRQWRWPKRLSRLKRLSSQCPGRRCFDAAGALGDLADKIVIEATNPLTPTLDLAVGFTDSAGETVVRLAKGARVVKAFHATGAENMAQGALL
jgi:predicted dinucleotide-binding enzyme